MSGIISRFVKHSGVYAIGSILDRAGALLLLPLYTSYLSVSQYGQLEILYSTNAVLRTLFGAGLAHTTLRFYYDEKQEALRGRIVTTIYAVSMALAGSAVLIGQRWVGDMARWLLGTAELHTAVSLTLTLMVLELSSEICLAYCRVREWSLFFVTLSLARLLVQVGTGIYFVKIARYGVEGVLASNLVSVALVWVILTAVTLRACGFAFDAHRLPAIFKYSLPLAASGLIGVVSSNADRFFLRTFVSVEAVGVYGLGLKFAELLRYGLIEPFQRGYGPFRFSILDREDAKDIQRRIVSLLLAGSGLCAVGLATVVPAAIRLMSPPSYWGASAVTAVALIGTIASGLAYCFETGMLMQRRTDRIAWTSLASLAVAVSLQAAMTPMLGIHGAMTATVLAQVFAACLTHIVAFRLYPLRYFAAPQYRVAALTAIMLVGCALVPAWSAAATIALAALLVGAYALFVLIFDHEARDFAFRGYAKLRTASGLQPASWAQAAKR